MIHMDVNTDDINTDKFKWKKILADYCQAEYSILNIQAYSNKIKHRNFCSYIALVTFTQSNIQDCIVLQTIHGKTGVAKLQKL